MYQDPEKVTLDQVRQALTVMGINPDVAHVRTIYMEPRQITITRYQVNDNGHHFRAEGRPGVATETSTIRVVGV